MVVNNFNLARVSIRPFKNDPPLIVDPNAVSIGKISLKLLQPIARRNPQIINASSSINMN